MTEDTALDTAIHEPSIAAGEVDMLLFALDRSRAQFSWKGGGLIKHMALVDDRYTSLFVTGQWDGPWKAVDFDAAPEWDCHTAAGDSPEELCALWRGAVERTRHVGHADLFREAIDGLVGEDPPQ